MASVSKDKGCDHQRYLLHCVLWGFGIELLWIFSIVFFGDSYYGLVKSIFSVPVSAFRQLNFLGIIVFESLLILLYLVPFLAMWCMKKCSNK